MINPEITPLDDVSPDDLDALIPGFVTQSLPADGFCGPDSTMEGTDALSLRGARLDAAGSCTFSVDVLVPDTAVPGDYENVTSSISVGGVAVGAPATANLTILPHLPALIAAFSPSQIVLGDIPQRL